MNKPTENTDWRAPTAYDDEAEIVWLYDKFLFPLVRQSWNWSRGKTRKISQNTFNDNRIIVGFSTLRPDASSHDGLFLRRCFWLLPKDIEAIQNYWNSPGEKWALRDDERAILVGTLDMVTPINVRAGIEAPARLQLACFENQFCEVRKMLQPILEAHTRTYPNPKRTRSGSICKPRR